MTINEQEKRLAVSILNHATGPFEPKILLEVRKLYGEESFVPEDCDALIRKALAILLNIEKIKADERERCTEAIRDLK